MEIKAVVDRIEDGIAVFELETGECINWPETLLPENTVKGTLLKITMESDKEENLNRNIKISQLHKRVFNQ